MWPFLVVAGTILVPAGYLMGLLSALPTGGNFTCTHGSGNALIPIVGPLIRVSNFGPRFPDPSDTSTDCGDNRAPVVVFAILSETVQFAGVAAYAGAAITATTTDRPRRTSIAILPGAAGAPLGATLNVITF